MLIFVGVKSRPEITNLPDSTSFAEDTSVGTTLFEATLNDPDVGESHVYSVAIEPASESSKFNLNSSSISSL